MKKMQLIYFMHKFANVYPYWLLELIYFTHFAMRYPVHTIETKRSQKKHIIHKSPILVMLIWVLRSSVRSHATHANGELKNEITNKQLIRTVKGQTNF